MQKLSINTMKFLYEYSLQSSARITRIEMDLRKQTCNDLFQSTLNERGIINFAIYTSNLR